MVALRVLDPSEVASREGYEVWGCVIERDGERIGQVLLARALGQVFGYDMWVRDGDSSDALRLWKRAAQHAREWGCSHVLVHLTGGEDPRIGKFWLERFSEAPVILGRVPV